MLKEVPKNKIKVSSPDNVRPMIVALSNSLATTLDQIKNNVPIHGDDIDH